MYIFFILIFFKFETKGTYFSYFAENRNVPLKTLLIYFSSFTGNMFLEDAMLKKSRNYRKRKKNKNYYQIFIHLLNFFEAQFLAENSFFQKVLAQ